MNKDKMTTVRINSNDHKLIKKMKLSVQKILDLWILENIRGKNEQSKSSRNFNKSK